MSAAPPFTLVLCEGFHDRSFLAGVLVERLGWREPAIDAEGRRLPYQDRWGKVAGGDFGYLHGESGAQLRLRPCHGHTKVPDVVRRTLQSRATHSFDHLLINYDGDKGGDGPDFLERIHQSVREMLVRYGAEPESAGEGRFLIDGGAREVRAVVGVATTLRARESLSSSVSSDCSAPLPPPCGRVVQSRSASG